MLQTLDNLWKEHLAAMDHLRQGIHLRGYAQKNPKQEYKREAFELFTQMLENLKQQVVSIVCRVQVQEPDVDTIEEQRRQFRRLRFGPTAMKRPMHLLKIPPYLNMVQVLNPFVRDGNKVGE